MRPPDIDIEKLVYDHYERVFRTLVRLTGRWEEAADLTQKVFVEAFKSRHTFEGRSSASTWLMKITIRTWKGSLKRPPTETGLEREIASPESPCTGWLMELFEALPPGQREAFYLYEVEGYSIQEIAGITSVPTGTVKARLHFARKNLQRKIEAAERSEKELLYEPTPSKS